MATPRVLLVHGAATTSRVWDRVRALLRDDGVEVVAPDRPSSGDLTAELAALADDADGAVVVGVSGGATLGLALASDRVVAGAVLHEPAVGSLVPGLLDHVVAGFTTGGVPGFGARALRPLLDARDGTRRPGRRRARPRDVPPVRARRRCTPGRAASSSRSASTHRRPGTARRGRCTTCSASRCACCPGPGTSSSTTTRRPSSPWSALSCGGRSLSRARPALRPRSGPSPCPRAPRATPGTPRRRPP